MISLPSVVDDELQFLSTRVSLESQDIIEIGCGDGAFARRLLAIFPHIRVTGIDVDEQQYRRNVLSESERLQYLLGSADMLPVDDQRFDLALMLKSLHHVPYLLMDAALAEAARVIRPDGYLYVSEPVFDGPFNDIVRLFHDEEQVRTQAQCALDRALKSLHWQQEFDHVFMTPIVFRDFEHFEQKIIAATYQEHRLSADLLSRVREKFDCHMGADGARFVRPMRARLLRRTRGL